MDCFYVFAKSEVQGPLQVHFGEQEPGHHSESLFWGLQCVVQVGSLNIVSICVGYTPPLIISTQGLITAHISNDFGIQPKHFSSK